MMIENIPTSLKICYDTVNQFDPQCLLVYLLGLWLSHAVGMSWWHLDLCELGLDDE